MSNFASGYVKYINHLEQINDAEFLVIFPFQDGTPYYLTSRRKTIDIAPGTGIDLGRIRLHLHL